MNEPLHRLEDELRRMRPHPFPPTVMERVSFRLAARSRHSTARLWMAAAAAFLAMAGAAIVIGRRPAPRPETPSPAYGAGTAVVACEDLGSVVVGGRPMRGERRWVVDRIFWRARAGDPWSVRSMPREELTFVSVPVH